MMLNKEQIKKLENEIKHIKKGIIIIYNKDTNNVFINMNDINYNEYKEKLLYIIIKINDDLKKKGCIL